MSSTTRVRPYGGAVLALLAVPAAVVVAGCSVSPQVEDAEQAAQAFYDAVADGDGDAACALLAPSVVAELEGAAGTPCARAIAGEPVPEVGGVVRSSAYGQNAQVELRGDVAFLSIFDGGWRVIAAGCTERVDRPYDCVLQGG